MENEKPSEESIGTYPSLRAAFERLVRDMEEAGVQYAVLGALGRAAWGTVRATTDIDFTMKLTPSGLGSLDGMFRRAGFERLSHPRVPSTGDLVPDLVCFQGRTDDRAEALRVDILVAKVEFMELALARRERAEADTVSSWAVSPEDLIVYKLISHRGIDLSDIEDVIGTQTARGRRLDWAYVKKWAREWEVETYLRQFLPRRKSKVIPSAVPTAERRGPKKPHRRPAARRTRRRKPGAI